jgi:quinol monooxygenase YgiN
MNSALFIKHTAKPGKRDDVKRIWDKYVRSYVAGNDGQPAYFYCFDNGDPDTIMVFQLHASQDGGSEFTQQPWYEDYERETAELLAGPSEFRSASPQWIKTAERS